MSTIDWVCETKAVAPPFQGTIDTAAAWLRKISRFGQLLRARYFGADRIHADPIDEEEFLDAWARYQDSAIRLYANEQHRTSHLGDRRRMSGPRIATRFFQMHLHTWRQHE
jgi:hypothetical protein